MINEPKKFVIVFDIDGVICKPPVDSEIILDDLEYIDQFQQLHPECHAPMEFNYKEDFYLHFFPPYLDILFKFLINHNCRIAFFSAGMEERNLQLIEHLLTNILDENQYYELKNSGQFVVFSKNSLTQDKKKDISVILNTNEDPDNSALIEDQVENATDNTSCIGALNLFHWDLWCYNNNSIKCLPKNAAYYLLGIFVSYFGKNNHNNISLKNWLEFINLNKQPPNNIIFIEHMINIGLQEVQKEYHDAICYGTDCFAIKKLTNIPKF
jgi:hypothetical protein